MKIEDHLNIVLLNHLPDRKQNWLINAARVGPATVRVIAAEFSSGVAMDHSIDIEHGYNSDKVVVEDEVG